jgi:hypothetical protein
MVTATVVEAKSKKIQTGERREGIVSGLVKTAAFVGGSSIMPIAVMSNLLLKRGNDEGLI